MEKRKWNIEKIMEESRNFWEKNGDFSPTFIFKNYPSLHFQIYSPRGALSKKFKERTGIQRWLWIVKKLGLSAQRRKIRIDRLKSCRWKWIVFEA